MARAEATRLISTESTETKSKCVALNERNQTSSEKMNSKVPKREVDIPEAISKFGNDDEEFSHYIPHARHSSQVGNDGGSQFSSGGSCRNPHPFEVNYGVSQFKRRSSATRSLDHESRRRRTRSHQRSRSYNQEELSGLVDEESKYSEPHIRSRGGESSPERSIKDFLPSWMAACDGTRTIALRRSLTSRRRRSGKSRKGDVTGEASSDVVAVMMEDVTDSVTPSNIQTDSSDVVTIEELKCCATTMEKKKKKREQLLSQTRTAQSGYQKWLPAANKKLWRRCGRNATSLSQHFELWTSSFKQIEGKFGASVFSYFVFVRLLFFLNLSMTLVIVATIIAPQTSIHSFDFLWTNCFGYNSSDSILKQSCDFTDEYHKHIEAIRGNSSTGDLVIDFFLGTGWMENSSLFIGFYWSEGYPSARYNMALAYLLTTGFYLAAIFIFMVIYTGKGIKERMLQNRDQPSNTFERVFCGWDYSLCQPTSAKEKHKSIYQELEMIYTNWKNWKEQVKLTYLDKFRLYSIRAFVHTVVIILLIGSGAAIALTVTKATPELQGMKLVQKYDFLDLIVSFLPSIVLTFLNIILPVIFRNIVLLEKYSDENQLRISLVRTVFLRLASIAVLVVTVIMQIHNCKGQPCQIRNSALFVHCWETYMGQQLYRLVILDFVIVIITILLYDFPTKYLVKRFPGNCLLMILRNQEFDVPQNVIDITYAQALCWIGAFFSPLIPAMTALKMLIFFFAKKETLMRNYKPKPSRASGTTYFFMIILMIAFILCSAAIAYAIARLKPSKSCGPFRVYADENFHMFNALTIAIESLPPATQKFFSFVGSWIFYLILVILFSFLIIWYEMKASAHRQMVEFLKEKLKIENQDKKFLLDRWKAMHEPKRSTGATR